MTEQTMISYCHIEIPSLVDDKAVFSVANVESYNLR
jgi:hypothetical protein